MLPGFHAPRTKQCSMCSKPFTPARPLQAVCSPRCAAKIGKVKRAKEKNAEKLRKRALETIPELIKVAQREFNSFIRARDAGKPCICCGLPLGEGEVGGSYDCGHYRSTGSAPHLRFDERNAHAQRKRCNRWGAGRAVDYRRGLIERIGLEAVEALEADNSIRKWTREELREIAATYRAKRKELERDK
jgi:predicted nucleic acid-binding Zn ribbon protein